MKPSQIGTTFASYATAPSTRVLDMARSLARFFLDDRATGIDRNRVVPALYLERRAAHRLDHAALPARGRQRGVLAAQPLWRRVLLDQPDHRVAGVQGLVGRRLGLEQQLL